MPEQLASRPMSGKLVVPFMVDETLDPIDFKAVDPEHVRRCAQQNRCGVCGGRIKPREPFAFIGPDDGRRCFADPWMHLKCARLAMLQCPFLAGRRDWREEGDNPLLGTYAHNMALYQAPSGSAHLDQFKHWHFAPVGGLWKPARELAHA
jgi:hypothetical protein